MARRILRTFHRPSTAGVLLAVFITSGMAEKGPASTQAGTGTSVVLSDLEKKAVTTAESLLTLPGVPKSFEDRLEFFSRILEGVPYFLGPTGEGRTGSVDTMPLADLRRFDCVTYMESTLALSLSGSVKDFLPSLLRIRYRSDSVSYMTRNHFFVEDWLKNNSGLIEILRLPGDTIVEKSLDKLGFFKRKGLAGPDSNPSVQIMYMPYARILDMAGNWPLNREFLGLAFLSQKPGLDVFHTGFLLAVKNGRPKLRHAGQTAGKVVTEDFRDYLVHLEGKTPGVLVFQFLEPGEL